MGNIRVTIANKDPNSIKKIYRNLPESLFPIALVRVYISEPQKPLIYGLVLISEDIDIMGSTHFFVMGGNMISQEHKYYSQLLSITSMICDMYSPVRMRLPVNASKIKVPSRSLDQRVPLQRY